MRSWIKAKGQLISGRIEKGEQNSPKPLKELFDDRLLSVNRTNESIERLIMTTEETSENANALLRILNATSQSFDN